MRTYGTMCTHTGEQQPTKRKEVRTMTSTTITYDGKTYTLMMDAYAAYHRGENVYEALAICNTDIPDEDGLQPVYTIHWDILSDIPVDDWVDESNLCDWDSPSEVYASGDEYNAAQDSIY